jgi:hypothetical protein
VLKRPERGVFFRLATGFSAFISYPASSSPLLAWTRVGFCTRIEANRVSFTCMHRGFPRLLIKMRSAPCIPQFTEALSLSDHATLESVSTCTAPYPTLPEGFPCFCLSSKANAKVKPAQTGHGLFLIFVLYYVLFVFCVFLCCSMYWLFCDVLCIVCVYMCTELLPPGGYQIAVKYIIYLPPPI